MWGEPDAARVRVELGQRAWRQFGKRLSQINCVNCSETNARSNVQDDDISESRTDPAEQNGYLRYFYRDWRPTRLGRISGRVLSWLTGLGLTPRILLILRVKGRSSGRLRSTILVVANRDGRTISYQCSETIQSGCATFAQRAERLLSSGVDQCQSRSLKFLQRSGRPSLRLGARSPRAVGTTCRSDTTRLCPRLKPSRRTTQSFELARPGRLSVETRRRTRDMLSIEGVGLRIPVVRFRTN